MPTNHYFQRGRSIGEVSEQNLIEDLTIETLKIYGHDILYMPRTLVNRDTLFEESELSKFTQAYHLEMYMEPVEGFEGEGDLFQKFGIEVRDSATFVVSRRRWEQQVESAKSYGGSFQLDARPAEGDLLYFPMTKSLFEIKFVEHQNPFYQVGKLHTYRLRCELFEYSSEQIDTGDTDIDALEDELTLDTLLHQFKLETGDNLVLEDGGSLILQTYTSRGSTVGGDNADFVNIQAADQIIDFTESNPFGEF